MSITAIYRVAIVVAVIGAASSDVIRRVTVDIKNDCTSHRLTNPRTYIRHGKQLWHYENGLTDRGVSPGDSATVKFEKKVGALRGTAAVFTLDLAPINDAGVTGLPTKRVAFMFSLAHSFIIYLSWQGAGFFGTFKECDYELYYEMHDEQENGFQRREIDQTIDYSDGRFTVKQLRTHGKNNNTPTFVLQISDNNR